MPRIAREGGFDIFVHPDDHPPPHVHVYFGGRRVRVTLHGLKILGKTKVKPHLETEIISAVRKHAVEALKVWEEVVEKGRKRQ